MPAVSIDGAVLDSGCNTADAPTVYYGQKGDTVNKWRVIGFDGNGVASKSGNMTLFAFNNLNSNTYSTPFALQTLDEDASNAYATSRLKQMVDQFVDDEFTAKEERRQESTRKIISTWAAIQ